ncbi:hypothetical protein [Streptomyces sp. SPB162]|uniref:hypothetical protein n=1 Tax=Streptomyces sp. SPB162 TaxID=2940560 RepID=UPI002406CCBD|nr:hypothetical protein [Streptomyces sp. SPB162]MDF9817078.1 serine/threonine protein kinase [Streptomyces sp. SPB162]
MISPKGSPMRLKVRFGPDRPRLVRPPTVARRLQLGDDWKGFQVRLPAADTHDPAALALLETETAAALTLHRAYSGTRFAGLFPVPFGYDPNAAEPFIVYAVPRGRPASALQGISTSQQRSVERDLVLAVRLMAAVGLVHRGIVPAAVRCEERGAQVWDLGSVIRTGFPRAPFGIAPYAAPEQRAGTGTSDPRDALWSVGQIMYQLLTGRPGRPDGPPSDLAAHRSLAQTLGPVFAPNAADRPTAENLLKLLMPGTELPVGAQPDPLTPYRRDFDEALRRKYVSLAASQPPVYVPTAEDPSHRAGPPPAEPPGTAYPGRFPDPLPAPDRNKLRDWFYGGSTSRSDPDHNQGGRYR